MKRRTIKKQSKRATYENYRWFKQYRGLHNYWWLELYGIKIGRITGCAFFAPPIIRLDFSPEEMAEWPKKTNSESG